METNERPTGEWPAVELTFHFGPLNCLIVGFAMIMAFAGFLIGLVAAQSWSGAWRGAAFSGGVTAAVIWLAQFRSRQFSYRISGEGILKRRHGREIGRCQWEDVSEIRPSKMIVLRSGTEMKLSNYKVVEVDKTVRWKVKAVTTAAELFFLERWYLSEFVTPEITLRYYRAVLQYRRESCDEIFADEKLVAQVRALAIDLEGFWGRPLRRADSMQDMMLEDKFVLPNLHGQYPRSEYLDPNDAETTAYWEAPCVINISRVGPLATIARAENCSADRLAKVLDLLRRHGFDYVPFEDCDKWQPPAGVPAAPAFFRNDSPSGPPASMDGPITWFDLFFSYT